MLYFIAAMNVKVILTFFQFSHVIFKGNQASISRSYIYVILYLSTGRINLFF